MTRVPEKATFSEYLEYFRHQLKELLDLDDKTNSLFSEVNEVCKELSKYLRPEEKQCVGLLKEGMKLCEGIISRIDQQRHQINIFCKGFYEYRIQEFTSFIKELTLGLSEIIDLIQQIDGVMNKIREECIV